ncbi:MAG: hypothetical protein ACYDHW_07155 [Syntrophorhabdaceae bacterium]
MKKPIQDHELLKERTSRFISFIHGMIICALGLFAGWAFFSGMADEQALREVDIAQIIEEMPTGKTVQINGIGLFKTSHHAGAVGNEAFREGGR